MEPVTIENRKKELQLLLELIQTRPSHDWTRERERIVVLQQMIAASEKQGQPA